MILCRLEPTKGMLILYKGTVNILLSGLLPYSENLQQEQGAGKQGGQA
ncbi:hypothetical protein WKK05_10595 [Nostoc sp. UHCC 0302]